MRQNLTNNDRIPITFNYNNEKIVGSATKNPNGTLSFTIENGGVQALLNSEDEVLLGISFVTIPKVRGNNE